MFPPTLLWLSLASGPQNPLPLSNCGVTLPWLKAREFGNWGGVWCSVHQRALHDERGQIICDTSMHNPKLETERGAMHGSAGPSVPRRWRKPRAGQFSKLLMKMMRRLKTENLDWEQNTRSWSRWITKQQRFCFYTNILRTKNKRRKTVGENNVQSKQNCLKKKLVSLLIGNGGS